MTKKDKELLLKDLSIRLPYGVICKGTYTEEADYSYSHRHLEKITGQIEGIDHIGFDDGEVYVTIEGIQCELSDVKIYLRPLSSMTKEERRELLKLGALQYDSKESLIDVSCLGFERHIEVYEWLYKHHFDLRNLIEKGLALRAPEGMYD